MAEPTTTTTIAFLAASVTLSSLVPGADGNAIVGAFAGAALMALHARDVSMPSRLAYLAISWVMGYLAAPTVMRQTPIQESGVAAFLAGALVIAITVQLIERVKTIDVFAQLTRMFKKGGP